MDAWQTSVEARLGEIRSEMISLREEMYVGFRHLDQKVDAQFKWMLGSIGAVLLALASGFLWIADKLP